MEYKFFKRKKVNTTEDYLECAMQAENYVHTFLENTEDGIKFNECEDYEADSFYKGTAGVLHMYVQFDTVCPDDKYKFIIKELTRYLSNHYLDGVNYAKKNGEFVPGMAEGFYTGLAGIGLILNEVYRQYRDENAKITSEKIVSYYKEHVVKQSDGIYWSGNSPVFFDSGIILFLIDFHDTFKDDSVSQIVEDAAGYILKHGIYHEDGGLEIDNMNVSFKHKEPNFEFGTAGAAFMFTNVFEFTENEEYLNAAKACVKYLLGISVKQKKGYLIPYKLGVYDNLFYLGNCHGPVGTAKLFYELYKVTDDEFYYNQIIELCDGMESLGAPYRQSAGYWNTTCVCCGPAGFVPLYAGLYFEKSDERFKNLADGVGEILLGSRTESKMASWEIAFDRTKPDNLGTSAGYFIGAAGIAVSLLELYTMHNRQKHILKLIDSPYPV